MYPGAFSAENTFSFSAKHHEAADLMSENGRTITVEVAYNESPGTFKSDSLYP